MQKATGRENAVRLPESKIIKELVEAEHVGKIGERFYITKDGAYIAQGALELYPELRDISAQMPKGGGDAESARYLPNHSSCSSKSGHDQKKT